MPTFDDLISAFVELCRAEEHLPGEHDQADHGNGGGGGSSDEGDDGKGKKKSKITVNTDEWRKGNFKPKSWDEVEAGKGDKFMLTGRDGEPLIEMQVVKDDPYRRFPIVKVTKIVNSNPKDREVADYFLGRESGGEIALADADISHFKPIKRAKR
jgi:hypothetical protein